MPPTGRCELFALSWFLAAPQLFRSCRQNLADLHPVPTRPFAAAPLPRWRGRWRRRPIRDIPCRHEQRARRHARKARVREERKTHGIGGAAGAGPSDHVVPRCDRGGPAPAVGGGRRDRRRGRPARLRDGRAHRLPAAAAGGRAAGLDGGGLARARLLPPAWRQGRGARRRHLAFGRRAARGGRGGDRHLAHEPRARGRLHEPCGPRPGRRHQPRHQRRRPGPGLLLRARPVEPARLHARRQHRHELGRRALPQVRRDDQQRARHTRWC